MAIVIDHYSDNLFDNLSMRTVGQLMAMRALSKAALAKAKLNRDYDMIDVYAQECDIITEVISTSKGHDNVA